jgi:nucleotide-binding universal stress UspA family protein
MTRDQPFKLPHSALSHYLTALTTLRWSRGCTVTINVLVGYDGSPAANAAIGAGAMLFPDASASIAYLWTPPFGSKQLRRRLRLSARTIDELIHAIEKEGGREAEQLVAMGVTVARAAGWDAEPLVKRTWAGEGLSLSQVAEERRPDVVVVGSRGLSGTEALLGSVSDVVVHHATRPVMVVPYPLLSAEYAALTDKAVLVGWDGSTGAQAALAATRQLFPNREVLAVSVDTDPEPVPADLATDASITSLQIGCGRGFGEAGVADALKACANHRDVAVLVVGSRGRSAAREMVLGSVAKATLHNAERPVIVVPRA